MEIGQRYKLKLFIFFPEGKLPSTSLSAVMVWLTHQGPWQLLHWFQPVISVFLVALWPEMVLEFQSLCLCKLSTPIKVTIPSFLSNLYFQGWVLFILHLSSEVCPP